MSLTLDSSRFAALIGALPLVNPSAEVLGLTVVLHPDPGLLGARAEWPQSSAGREWIIGRCEPGFVSPSAPAHPECALADRHVSRRAIALSALQGTAGRSWQLRSIGSCPVHVDGAALRAPLSLSPERLRAGVQLRIAHRVLLLLRLGESAGGLNPPLPGLLGSSPAMCLLREQLRRIARSDSDVLLLGATGTGKEQAARALHQLGARRHAPWVAVNLAALAPELAAGALFGARRGAYTGAVRDLRGYFAEADGGTLFLDEVGDAPPAVQPQLLRALEQREVQVLGGEVYRVDLRVLSATDVDIADSASGFRAALRHRLGAMELQLPALAERPEDIGLLCLHYLDSSLQAAGRPRLYERLAAQPLLLARVLTLLERLLCHDWPGNVRELLNVCRQLAVLGDEDFERAHEVLARLGAPHTPAQETASARASVREAAPTAHADCPAHGRRAVLRALDDAQLSERLRAHDFSVARLAAELGVSRQALYRRLRGVVDCRTAGSVPAAEIERALLAAGGDVLRAALALGVSGRGLRARLSRERRQRGGSK